MRHIVAGHLLLVSCPWEGLTALQSRVSQGLFLNDLTLQRVQKQGAISFVLVITHLLFKKTIHKNYILYNPIDTKVKI